MSKTFIIRDPIHGFIELNEWERDIVNHPIFQRLRKIRQLGLTDMVYPGAMHTRFEHSLGVMHIATKMFDCIVKKRFDFLVSELDYNKSGLDKDRVIVRLASLLHDIGHAPFSHCSEELMCKNPQKNDEKFKHEDYSAAAVKFLMYDVIENHRANQNYKISAQDIAEFLDSASSLGRCLIWRDLVSSQLDADRADYLLRDSYHIGVTYGNYDLKRLLESLTIIFEPETQSPKIAVEEGGSHVAEALIIARYMMFTQVYFQRTRRAYDYHIAQTVKGLLNDTQRNSEFDKKVFFPPPTKKEFIEQYLSWNDFRVLGSIEQKKCNKHGLMIYNRSHYRCVFETPDQPVVKDFEGLEEACNKLESRSIPFFIDTAEKSWYKTAPNDIYICLNDRISRKEEFIALSDYALSFDIKSINKRRIYVPYDCKDKAKEIIKYCKI